MRQMRFASRCDTSLADTPIVFEFLQFGCVTALNRQFRQQLKIADDFPSFPKTTDAGIQTVLAAS